MFQKHVRSLKKLEKRSSDSLSQEIFTPYFCPGQDKAWYESAETVPSPTTERMQELCQEIQHGYHCSFMKKKNKPVFCIIQLLWLMRTERISVNTEKITSRILLDSGKILFQTKVTSDIPCFKRSMQKLSVYICYDRHFPEGARILGLNGAESSLQSISNRCRTFKYLWKLEQPARAAANGYFMGCINRVGEEKPWNLGKFYGSSYFVDPRGQIFSQASEDKDELLIAEFDLDMIEQNCALPGNSSAIAVRKLMADDRNFNWLNELLHVQFKFFIVQISN